MNKTTAPAIISNPLPYQDRLQSRAREAITALVIHCTETPDLRTAREFGERIHYRDSGTGNSGHYYIGTGGRIEQYVDTGRIAHHVRGYNEHSIGIELVNQGRWPDWLHSSSQNMSAPYPAAQIEALIGLIHRLRQELPALRWISGHEDLDRRLVAASDNPRIRVRRKLDPGPLFPWPEVLEQVRLERYPRIV